MNESEVEELAGWVYETACDGAECPAMPFASLSTPAKDVYRHLARELLTNPPPCLALPQILIVRPEPKTVDSQRIPERRRHGGPQGRAQDAHTWRNARSWLCLHRVVSQVKVHSIDSFGGLLMVPEMQRIDPPERKRTYIFPNGTVQIKDVVGVCVRPSGNHRIDTVSGKKYIVASGWLVIELEMDAWTF